MLASFTTVIDAVSSACAIMKGCADIEGLQLRIGIHLGDVVFENEDVFGDGVNIASRLQTLARSMVYGFQKRYIEIFQTRILIQDLFEKKI